MKPKQLDTEIMLHAHLGRHKNVIQFLTSGQDEYWRWIAMELAEGGDLFDKIESDIGVGEQIAHFYFTQLVNAVSQRFVQPELKVIDKGGHWVHVEFPGLVAAMILDFIDTIEEVTP